MSAKGIFWIGKRTWNKSAELTLPKARRLTGAFAPLLALRNERAPDEFVTRFDFPARGPLCRYRFCGVIAPVKIFRDEPGSSHRPGSC